MGLTVLMFIPVLFILSWSIKDEIVENTCFREKKKPFRPMSFEVTWFDNNSVVVGWTAPLSPGSRPIRFYAVSFRNTDKNLTTFLFEPPPHTRNEWNISKKVSPHTLAAKVDNLEGGCVYEFRVVACNKYGVGEAAYTFFPMPAPYEPPIADRLSWWQLIKKIALYPPKKGIQAGAWTAGTAWSLGKGAAGLGVGAVKAGAGIVGGMFNIFNKKVLGFDNSKQWFSYNPTVLGKLTGG